ncbi:MAG: PQQ-dependent catabolism-associated CXXCW motif protein [Acetobacteraceae bacterium]|nr:PQQ-dependent catabolism-associated CXXCW motif protein [Acetobacteraceae bacterium]
MRRTAHRPAVLALSVLAFSVVAGAGAPPPPEPQGYRMEDYRAPTPATLHGASLLTVEQAHALWQAHEATFIDVLPRPPRPVGLPASTIWRPKPRADLPGSLWLADTGYGALAPATEQYFERGLEKATDGDRNRMVVFYCLKDCWMSWNAAKRALSLGYTRVGWFPEGTDGWATHDFPLEPREPEPRPDMTE